MDEDALRDARAQYWEFGWAKMQGTVDPSTVTALNDRLHRISREHPETVTRETETGALRAVHGCHMVDDLCASIVRTPLFVASAEAFLSEQVYVYQFKVNFKAAHVGERWPWHCDFDFWHIEDGMQEPRACNILVLLDASTPNNGALSVIPHSHIDFATESARLTSRSRSSWRDDLSSRLSYTLDERSVSTLRQRYGTVQLTGSPGNVFAFHPRVAHASDANTSEKSRAALIITYNAMSNAPKVPSRRPWFLAEGNPTPIGSR